MLKVRLDKMAQSYARIRKTPNNTLARTHYINFLREENKFANATGIFEKDLGNWSLKVLPDFIVSVIRFGKMCSERFKSAYYFQR